jgi:hypothetical protein
LYSKIINFIVKLSNLLQTYFHPVKFRLSFLKRPDYPNEEIISRLFKAAYEDCAPCGKCALTRPMVINTGEFLFLARTILCSIGRLPDGLVHPVETAFKVGNYLGLSPEDFVEMHPPMEPATTAAEAAVDWRPQVITAKCGFPWERKS